MTAASVPIPAFLEFFLPVLGTIFVPSHWLLSHITIVKTVDRDEKGMNVAMTIINHWKLEYWQSRELNQRQDKSMHETAIIEVLSLD